MKRIFTLLTVMVVTVAIVFIWGSLSKNAAAPSSSTVDRTFNAEQKEVIAAIQEFYDITTVIGHSGQVDLLDAILIDAPVYQETMDKDRFAYVTDYIARVSGKEVARPGFGYLTAMKNKMTHLHHAWNLMEEAEAAKGSDLSGEDLTKLRESNYNSDLGLSLVNYYGNKGKSPEELRTTFLDEQFIEIKIDRDRADVYYETARGQHAILLRVDGKWKIAVIQ